MIFATPAGYKPHISSSHILNHSGISRIVESAEWGTTARSWRAQHPSLAPESSPPQDSMLVCVTQVPGDQASAASQPSSSSNIVPEQEDVWESDIYPPEAWEGAA